MAKLDANLYRMFLESAVAGTFTVIGGQRSCSKTSSRSTFSNADKTSTVDTMGVGLRSVGYTCEGVPDLPDANGFTRAQTLFAAGTGTKIQIRKSPFAVGDVVEECAVQISQIDTSYPFNDAVGFQISFVPTAAPATETLS